jgi:hypothetical protein
MMTAVAVIGAVVVLEARPVYAYLAARTYGYDPDPTELIVGFGLAALLCVVAALLPIKVALRRLEAGE